MEYFDIKTIWTIIHIFGVAIGAGGAFLGDIMFTMSIRDRQIDNHEFRFLTLGGRMVWIGLFILIASGVGLFFTNPEGYLASAKFLTKMTVVGIILANGIFLHLFAIPKFTSSDFLKHKYIYFASGSISFVSWLSALILGALRGVPWSYFTTMMLYISVLVVAIIASRIFADILLPPKKD